MCFDSRYPDSLLSLSLPFSRSSRKIGAQRRDPSSSRVNRMRARAHTAHTYAYTQIYIHIHDTHTYTCAANIFCNRLLRVLIKEKDTAKKGQSSHPYTCTHKHTSINKYTSTYKYTYERVCDGRTRGNTNCGLIRTEYHRNKQKGTNLQ